MKQAKAAAVRFESVSKAYGSVVAVDRVSFTVEPGHLVTLLGPSGCGKTTTLRLIAGLERATSGRILIGETDVTQLPATDRNVSMVFQSYALFPHMTVLENVAYGLVVSGTRKADAHAMAEDGLATVGLAGYGSRMPSELSGGQQQRVAVARALVLEPEVLLFDEPLSNLDAKLRRRVREEIRDLQQKLGITAVYVTHDQAEALAISDKIIVMNKAAIAQEGTPEQLYEAPADLFVADFIGDANIVSGEIAARFGDMAEVRLDRMTVHLLHRNLAPGRTDVAIRPEAIRLHPARPAGASMEGTIRKATYLGSHFEYLVETPLGELFAIGTGDGIGAAVGATVHVTLADHGITLVGMPGARRTASGAYVDAAAG